MSEAFSIKREFDFVNLDGLRLVTGRPPHEWDIYIVKELIDNALDADEKLWQVEPGQYPRVQIRLEYIDVSVRQTRQLFVQVSNRANFPVDKIKDIFATQRYTSNKAFTKGLMRGALGNALKTLLGIPYALRRRVAGDRTPELKPMVIRCQGQTYLPRYLIDDTAQSICLDCSVTTSKMSEGTVIQVGLDHFGQEFPRTLSEIKRLAEQYHLCNPHAEFRWTVELEEAEWEQTYKVNTHWQNKFQGIAPVQWYLLEDFRKVLGALYRQQDGHQAGQHLTIDQVSRYFVGGPDDTVVSEVSSMPVAQIVQALGQSSMTDVDIESSPAMKLYQLLCHQSPTFDSIRLGAIGVDHVAQVLSQVWSLDGEIFYEIASDEGDDPNVSFIIEVAVARVKEGERRIWTALNFSPTYHDPFFHRWLRLPNQPDESVMGLRGLLEAAGVTEDEPVIFFLHLICPNLEHDDFSKSKIDHLPFKQVLGEVVERVLTTLRQAQEEAELRLKETIFQTIADILADLDQTERFIFDQLLAKLRTRLRQEPTLAEWLDTPDSLPRLRAYLTDYQSRNTVLTQHVARPVAGTVSLPLHPDGHFSIPAEQLSPDLLARHHVNKIFYVQGQGMAAVVLDNNWLCRMDMALLHNTPGSDVWLTAAGHCLVNSDLPLVVLHDADAAGQAIIEQMQTWLTERHFDTNRLFDLGLTVSKNTETAQPTRLVELMPGELATWLINRFAELKLPLKYLPVEADIRQAIRRQIEQRLHGYVWEGVSQQLHFSRLFDHLDQTLKITHQMIGQGLDHELTTRLNQANCAESYSMVLEAVVTTFFDDLVREHGSMIQTMVQAHVQNSER